MDTIIFLISLCVFLPVATIIHELGHFIILKVFGFKVAEFSLGSGVCIYKGTHSGMFVTVKLNVFSGGHVKISKKEVRNANAGRWGAIKFLKYAVAAAGGPCFNLLIACISIVSLNSTLIVAAFTIINISSALMNLMPFQNSDGAQIITHLRHYFDITRDNKRSA